MVVAIEEAINKEKPSLVSLVTVVFLLFCVFHVFFVLFVFYVFSSSMSVLLSMIDRVVNSQSHNNGAIVVHVST